MIISSETSIYSSGLRVLTVTPVPQDDNLDVTTYTVLILEKNTVQIPELAPSTAYLFKVQAMSSDGSPGSSIVEEQFETLPEGTEENRWKAISLMHFYVCFYLDNH